MIPRTIHYCWFGRGKLPKDAQRCISSWRKFLPGYEIKEWNEDNFNVDACAYTSKAYEQRKYAFVSDYARFDVLHRYGGLYFDTDVEIIKPIDHIIGQGPFMAIEKSLATNGQDTTKPVGVAPGLGIGAEKGMPLFKQLLDHYHDTDFSIEAGTVVTFTTALLKEHGMVNENTLQQVAGFNIYPDHVFCPMDSTTGIVTLTPETVAIHHYSCSWIDHNTLSWRMHQLKNALIRIFGPELILKLTRGRQG